MAEPSPPRTPRAGGVLIAIAALGGAIVGAKTGEPSLGLVAGIAIGVTAALVVWLIDRR